MTVINSANSAKVISLLNEREKRITIDWISLPQIERDLRRALEVKALLNDANEDLHNKRETLRKQINDAIIQSVSPINMNIKRALKHRYSEHPLSARGSLESVLGGRFSFGKIDSSRYTPRPVLYLAEDAETALYEFNQIEKNAHPFVKDGVKYTHSELLFLKCNESDFSLISMNCTLARVLDVRKSASLEKIVQILATVQYSAHIRSRQKSSRVKFKTLTKAHELHTLLENKNWRALPSFFGVPSSSQIFTEICFEYGVEAILYRSSKTKKDCLAICTNNLLLGSKITVSDKDNGIILLHELTCENKIAATLSSEDLKNLRNSR